MTNQNKKTTEKQLYKPIKKYLEEAFRERFGNCWLETTAEGVFNDTLKSRVHHDIIFSFLGKKASPDLTGFIHTRGSEWVVLSMASIKDFITVEIKKGKITLQDIYQAKMYGDLFRAKYALLISPEPIPEEIRRLDQRLFVTHRFMSGWYLHIGEWSSSVNTIEEFRWLSDSPFRD